MGPTLGVQTASQVERALSEPSARVSSDPHLMHSPTPSRPLSVQTNYSYAGISDIIVYNVSFDGPPPASKPVVPIAYPLFKQCDPAWASTEIGSAAGVTICDVGCLMSSVSMALAANGITIPNPWFNANSLQNFSVNPQSLNMWLQANGGYDDNDDLDEGGYSPRLNTTISVAFASRIL